METPIANREVACVEHQWTPETLMLVFLLNRTIRDLVEGDQKIRREAIKWLSDEVSIGLPYYVSYRDILDIIHLNDSRKQWVRDRIKYAQMLINCTNITEFRPSPAKIRIG